MAGEDVAAGRGTVTVGAEQPGFSMDLRLNGGGASLGFVQKQDTDPYQDIDVGEVAAATLGVGVQWGWFAGNHVQLGFAHSLARYQWSGQSSVESGLTYDDEGYWTEQSGFTLISPLGVYVEIFPSAEVGIDAHGASLSVWRTAFVLNGGELACRPSNGKRASGARPGRSKNGSRKGYVEPFDGEPR
jgi:hypothetical protein